MTLAVGMMEYDPRLVTSGEVGAPEEFAVQKAAAPEPLADENTTGMLPAYPVPPETVSEVTAYDMTHCTLAPLPPVMA